MDEACTTQQRATPAAATGPASGPTSGPTRDPTCGPTCDPTCDPTLDAALDALTAAVDALTEPLRTRLDGPQAAATLLRIDGLAGRLTAVAASLVPTVEADGWWAVGGARSSVAWLAGAGRMSFTRARSLVSTGRAMRDDLPTAAQAAINGSLPLDHLQILARRTVTSPLRRQALDDATSGCGERFLLAQADLLGAEQYTTLVRRWASAADPEADERGYAEATEREFLQLSTTTCGVHLAGFLTTDHGAAVRAALGAVMRPPSGSAPRTTTQRRAHGLVDLARLTLDHGLLGTGAAVRPHISCVVDLDTLRRAIDCDPFDRGSVGAARPGMNPSGTSQSGTSSSGGRQSRVVGPHLPPVADIERFAVAELLGSGPVPPSVLARLACDSEITRIVFGPESQVIDAGRAERTFSGARRRAIIARDQTCRYPGCDAPPALGELHHIDHWARDGGRTDTNAGILLCWHHHAVIHRRGIEISRAPSGGWAFTDRAGAELPSAA